MLLCRVYIVASGLLLRIAIVAIWWRLLLVTPVVDIVARWLLLLLLFAIVDNSRCLH